jgi:hypothetical protein
MTILPDHPLFSKSFLRTCCGLLASCLFISALSAQIREPTEFELKAALLYNFALFTEWPLSSGNTLNICLYGQDPYGDAIQVLKKKSIKNRRLNIDHPRQLADIDNCHILYIRSAELSQIESLITRISSKPILTILDIPGDNNNHAGIINLAMERQKIRFDVDLLAAHRAGLSLSSKLLRLAREVHQ